MTLCVKRSMSLYLVNPNTTGPTCASAASSHKNNLTTFPIVKDNHDMDHKQHLPLSSPHHRNHVDWESSWVSVVPGFVQGTTSTLTGHPMDTLKTRLQARFSNGVVRTSSFNIARDMVRQEGVVSFYRGVVPPLILVATKRSVQFSVFEWLNKQQGQKVGSHVPPALRPFLSGACAGAGGTILGCPLAVIKIQTQNTTHEAVRNAWHCTQLILRRDGVLGFYQGWKHHMVKDASFAGCYLGLYDTIAKHLVARQQEGMGVGVGVEGSNAPSTSRRRRSPFQAFVSGACASMMTWLLLFPIDSIKTCIQAKKAATVREVLLLGGIRPLYRGLGPALARAGPVSGLSMLMYEATREVLDTFAVQVGHDGDG